MSEWIEDVQPPRDYADATHAEDDPNPDLTIARIALLFTIIGLGAGWLLWG